MDDVMRVVAEGYHDMAIQDDDREPLHPAVAWEICTDGVCVTARAALAAEAARAEVAEPGDANDANDAGTAEGRALHRHLHGTTPGACGYLPRILAIEREAAEAARAEVAEPGEPIVREWLEHAKHGVQSLSDLYHGGGASGEGISVKEFRAGCDFIWEQIDNAIRALGPAATTGREPLDALREALTFIADWANDCASPEDTHGGYGFADIEKMARAALDTPDPGAS